jgi:hypothetical protein
MRAAIYARVSTFDQEPENQLWFFALAADETPYRSNQIGAAVVLTIVAALLWDARAVINAASGVIDYFTSENMDMSVGTSVDVAPTAYSQRRGEDEENWCPKCDNYELFRRSDGGLGCFCGYRSSPNGQPDSH